MKRLSYLAGLVAVFAATISLVAPMTASAAPFGRNYNNGYFYNKTDPCRTNGIGCDDVLSHPAGGDSIPGSVNSINSFISFLNGRLHDATATHLQNRAGASFIIETMLQITGPNSNYPASASQLNELKSRLQTGVNNGTLKISWNTAYTYQINSYFQQISAHDDSFFLDSGRSASIVFTDKSGNELYAIRRACGNPVGTTARGFPGIPKASSFKMSGYITLQDLTSGGRLYTSSRTEGATTNVKVRPGDKLVVKYYNSNAGPNRAPSQKWFEAHNDGSGWTHPKSGGPIGFESGQTRQVSTENITIGASEASGRQHCRSVGYTPSSSSNSASGSGGTICAVVGANFGLTPSVTVDAPVSDVGSTVTFRYQVDNDGPSKGTTACTAKGQSYAGVHTAGDGSGDPNVSPQPSFSCSNLAVNTTTVATEKVIITSAMLGKTICRALNINPDSAAGGSQTSKEVCVLIANKPYLQVGGGDVTAGNGFSTDPTDSTCDTNDDGSIVSWNRGSSSYGGAGTEYAAYAMAVISDFATAQGSGSEAPSALAFTNTSGNVSTDDGTFGGGFDAYGSCMSDFYDAMPSDAKTLAGSTVNVSSLGNGSYNINSANVTVSGGNVNSGQRTVLYVNGNVHITGDITYPGSWSVDKIPYFQIVAKGNIYIDPGVTLLAGAYIAQGGTLYTCATGFSAPPLNGSLFNTCNSNLKINGAVAANNVEFLRTAGTVSGSNVAETINYTPALWIAAPQNGTSGATYNYDAITSLPPVL